MLSPVAHPKNTPGTHPTTLRSALINNADSGSPSPLLSRRTTCGMPVSTFALKSTRHLSDRLIPAIVAAFSDILCPTFDDSPLSPTPLRRRNPSRSRLGVGCPRCPRSETRVHRDVTCRPSVDQDAPSRALKLQIDSFAATSSLSCREERSL